MRLELSEAADRDLDEILIYSTDRFGMATAIDYAESFAPVFAMLERHPRSGRTADGLPEVRRFGHRRHRIFYEIIGDRIIVLRILHHRMALDGRF